MNPLTEVEQTEEDKLVEQRHVHAKRMNQDFLMGAAVALQTLGIVVVYELHPDVEALESSGYTARPAGGTEAHR